VTRVDPHLHSRASTRTGNWFLQSAGLPESYTEPGDAHRTVTRRGMGRVTPTHHDTIGDAREISHQPDAFASAEATTDFPGENAPLHFLCGDVSEADGTEIERMRGNVRELVDLLTERRGTHAPAHSLPHIGAALIADHVERCLPPFPMRDGGNGARSRVGNQAAARVAEAVTPAFPDTPAETYGIAPCDAQRRELG